MYCGTPFVITRSTSESVTAFRNLPLRRSTPPTPSPFAPWHVVHCASYNLAAIHALLGNKGKAMELLRRHFYRFERYDSVREKERMEARVDYVFASLRNDREFVELTKLAQ